MEQEQAKNTNMYYILIGTSKTSFILKDTSLVSLPSFNLHRT
jgi:hypothetical protein